ncbi:MAG: hypothetical protein NZ610_00175 [Candidatus Bipolaricaulota bacterium]|nr:hypothetical protein [Candidatus Bipolaricaulota bacterium]MCS7273815.1 hypothetical protein [Candidatus Bipolaricaulota bacterium]MDW8110767.1 hypothetical protein [Candidatus Bipolaricaulota bacterium]MDW8328375.1 hypothetical protein [Candidatus Bipolaricaulota bacterium]
MAIETLAERLAASETWISLWRDTSENEIYLQYGYVDISMPVEDFEDLLEAMLEARQKLKGNRRA